MTEAILGPWPWYVAGPLLGLVVPALLLFTGKSFGLSSSLRHACAALVPAGLDYFRYDWKQIGLWNLVMVAGLVAGGLIATQLGGGGDVAVSPMTQDDLGRLGLDDLSGFVPGELIGWDSLFTFPGFVAIVIGGFLVGFGARYAGGCTSGHAIMGLATFEKASLVAVVGFFVGGLIATHFILPLLL